MTTTTLKLPPELKKRVARVAKAKGSSAHAVMVQAIEREISREERMREFVREALVSKAEIAAGGPVYRAKDVFAWMERLARGEKVPRPKPWRK